MRHHGRKICETTAPATTQCHTQYEVIKRKEAQRNGAKSRQFSGGAAHKGSINKRNMRDERHGIRLGELQRAEPGVSWVLLQRDYLAFHWHAPHFRRSGRCFPADLNYLHALLGCRAPGINSPAGQKF